MTEIKSKESSLYIRNVIFGVEDSLVSTVGLLAGIATGDLTSSKILMIGIVYLFVEGFSMAAGSYLSEHSVQEYETGEKVTSHMPLLGALAMFGSFIIAGLVPIAPYIFLPLNVGIVSSIVVSLFLLGVLGYTQAKISNVSISRGIVRMVVVGGVAIILGVVIGKVLGVA